ncbi:unnamed protein product [Caenorhabditis bovis]|uniref:Anaphase-promoting complex subunit 4-like WD40 domain-containing protein n=1 Tax=Caenorhabditis bovis TaxID=2654633 RepID=A0A8S1EMB3_9PELO|nr:unnamed protein product [Caenorhabditis bovis]
MTEPLEDINLREGKFQYSKKSYRAPFKVHTIALNPCNDLIALGSKNGDISLKRSSWKQIWKLNCNNCSTLYYSTSKPSSLESLEFSPDGSLLAVGMNDGHVHIYEAETGNYKHTSRPKYLANYFASSMASTYSIRCSTGC